MATNINETNQVEEQPATYNRNFQVMLIAGLVFVVIVMVYASLFRSGPDDREIEAQVQRELRKQAVSDPEQEFRARIKSQEQRLLQQRQQDLTEQQDYINEQTEALMQNNEQVLQELLSGTKSALESWDENETVRVRQSRQADFAFEFLAEGPDALALLMSNPNPAQATPEQLGPEQAASSSTRYFNLAGHPESDLNEVPDTDYALLSIGSVMYAKLDQKIISDFAGPYRCRIEQNVLDITQRQVLIPAGSLCTGEVIQTGSTQPNRIINNRMALSVRWIVRPDGSKIKFLSQALDHEGIGAVKGRTDYHFMTRLGGAAAFALLSSETARADYSSGGSGATFEADIGQSLRDSGAELVSPYAGLIPTQTLDYGQKLRLFVSEDIYIRPWRTVYQHLLSQAQ